MFSLSALLPCDNLCLETIHETDQGLTVMVASTTPSATCPGCQMTSARVHGHYTRTVADLPWGGRALVLQLRTPRFFCDCSTCPRKTFAATFGPALPAYARRTT